MSPAPSNGPVIRLRSASPEDTREIGAALAEVIQVGDVVALTGELGAGKTALTQGLARGLGIDARVTSPTFLLVKTYEGRVPLVHCDVYRLDSLQDVLELGDEVLAPEACTVIEWGDAITAILPEDHLVVVMTLDDDEIESTRTIELVPKGGWTARLSGLREACRPWLADDGNRTE